MDTKNDNHCEISVPRATPAISILKTKTNKRLAKMFTIFWKMATNMGIFVF